MFLKESDKASARELLNAIIIQGKLGKSASTYRRIKPAYDGRIRTVLNPAGTETGRLNSRATFVEPSTNLQNLNKKAAKEGPLHDVRKCITPTPGSIMCEADYSSAERRLLAYLAKERTAIQQIETGINAYKWFAGKLFNITDWEAISKDTAEYFIGKMSILALDRGVRPKTLCEQINASAHLTGAIVTLSDTSRAYNLFHQIYPGYRSYYEQVGRELRGSNFTITNVCGRKRTFFGRRNSQYSMESVIREAVSFNAQAVGDIINRAIIKIYNDLDPSPVRLLLQIHDAILWETSPDTVHESCVKVVDIMEEPILIHGEEVVIPAEVSISDTSWADLEDITHLLPSYGNALTN